MLFCLVGNALGKKFNKGRGMFKRKNRKIIVGPFVQSISDSKKLLKEDLSHKVSCPDFLC